MGIKKVDAWKRRTRHNVMRSQENIKRRGAITRNKDGKKKRTDGMEKIFTKIL